MRQHHTISKLTALALAALAAAAQAQTAPASGLAAAVQKAIETNPEVTVRLNALRAATNEIDVARGGYFPTVTLSGDAGRDSDGLSSRSPETVSFNRSGLALTANQVLWDGMFVRKEVERLGHARVLRYFEFMAATEDTALEAARAYLDVLRFRKLVSLAEDNYTQHKYVYDQLQSKVKAGVGRGVDFEQANARLALAESNLTTEISNLHDVSARYLRVVGEAPAGGLPQAPRMDSSITAANGDLISQALAKHASISASIENLRAVQSDASGRQTSPFQPRVEARIRSGVGNNFDGVQDRKRATSALLLLNWNLYNGGTDSARVRQFADLINQAADQRDKACRDVRQTAGIAHNDIQRARLQLAALDRNVLAIEKARDAYRQQFDIGQRSLLDLLNAENEVYTAKRAYSNADYDLQLAYARTQAARNTLSSTLGLTRPDNGQSDLVKDWEAGNDAAQRCPATAVDVPMTSREDLDNAARKMAVPAATTSAIAAPAVVAKAQPADGSVQAVSKRLKSWSDAWQKKDVDGYLSHYSKDFAPAKSTHAAWESNRRRVIASAGDIELKVDNVKTTTDGDKVLTAFDQSYVTKKFKDQGAKQLTWKQESSQWVIVKESNR